VNNEAPPKLRANGHFSHSRLAKKYVQRFLSRIHSFVDFEKHTVNIAVGIE